MKFCMQLSCGSPFAHAKLQLGRKGQRPKGQRPKFQKLDRNHFCIKKALHSGFTPVFVLKRPIVEDLVVSVHCAMKFFIHVPAIN